METDVMKADPYDISQDDEFIKEETIRKEYVRRSAQTAQNSSQSPDEVKPTGKKVVKKKEKESEKEAATKSAPSAEDQVVVSENGEYVCATCPRTFKSMIGRQRHMDKWCLKQDNEKASDTEAVPEGKCPCCLEDISSNHEKGDFECKECNMKFELETSLQRHKKVKHDAEESFSCPECSSQFTDKVSLWKHMSTHVGTKPWSCERCKITFTRKYHLVRHIVQTGCDGAPRPRHSCQKFRRCSCYRHLQWTDGRFRLRYLERYLEKKRKRPDELSKTETSVSPLKMPVAGTSAKRLEKTRIHTRNMTEDKVCGREFNRKDNLREHLRAHAGVNKRRTAYHCNLCDKEILGAHLYSRHKKEHLGSKPYPCSYCGKSFRTSGAQKKHIRKHTGEKPYECNECFTKFAAKETLNRHRRLHTGIRPFICKHCGKGFIQTSQLRAHIFYHTGEFGFQCDQCEKSFNRKTRLDIHKKYFHEGAEPMKCDHCSRQFFRKEDLARHILTHTGVKAFQCDVCNKAFAVKSSLKIHLLTHTKEPPRACNYCNRAFIRQDCLLRHMRAKHRDKLEEFILEAERKKLQLQLLAITNEVRKSDNVLSTVPESSNPEQLLSESISELLKLLVDEETLKSLGAPDAPVDKVLDMIIRRCGHQPAENPELSDIDRLRENAKLLFTVVIDDAAVKTLLNNQSVDEVILHVLNLAKS